MKFFANKSFNLIYAHAALQAFTMYAGEAFAFVYLLKVGIPVPVVLLAIGGLFGSRLLFRKLVVPVAKRAGLRNTLVFGIVLEGITYFLLPLVQGIGPMFFLHLTLLAVSSSFYWTTYHAYVARIGDSEHRGTQVSGLETVAIAVGIVAPIISGLILTFIGATTAFAVVGAVMMAAAIPIALGPDLQVVAEAEVPLRTRQVAWRVMFADGLRTAGAHFVWLVALFITLGEDFAAYGGALALAGVAGAAMGLLAGRSIDLGHGLRALQLGVGALAVAIAFRVVGLGTVWTAVLANAAASVAWPAYATAQTSKLYNLSKLSPCTLRYHVVAEGGWDAGVALGCLFAAALVHLGFGFHWPIALGLVGCLLVYRALAPEYASEPENP